MKKQHFFKALVCSMALCIVFSLCGCGDSDSNESSSQTKASTTVSSSEVLSESESNTISEASKTEVSAAEESSKVESSLTEESSKTESSMIEKTSRTENSKQENSKQGEIQVVSVYLNANELTLIEQESSKLIATIQPTDANDKKLIWNTTNANVATVDDNGNIMAVSPGVASITVSSSNGTTAACTVVVRGKKVEVSNINFGYSNISLDIGQSAKINAIISPDNATDSRLTWNTTNASVATVDNNGNIMAVSPGVASISVSSSNGKTATCTVVVKEKNIEVTGINLDQTQVSLAVGKTITISATVTPQNSSNKMLYWSTDDKKIATVDSNGTITAISPGSTIIRVAATNGIETICKVTVEEDLKSKEEYVMAAFGIDKLYNSIKFPSSLCIKNIIYEKDTKNGYGDTISRLVVCGYGDNELGGKSTAYCVVIRCDNNTNYPDAIKYNNYYLHFFVSNSDPSVHNNDVFISNQLSMKAYTEIFNKSEIPYD